MRASVDAFFNFPVSLEINQNQVAGLPSLLTSSLFAMLIPFEIVILRHFTSGAAVVNKGSCSFNPWFNYYVVPISRACTANYLGGEGNVALHGLITQCTLINSRKCGLHVFLFGSLFIILCTFLYKPTCFFFVVIQYFLSFGYCDALKDGLARTVKVFRNGARTSLLLSTGVPSMQTWPIIRNERRFQ